MTLVSVRAERAAAVVDCSPASHRHRALAGIAVLGMLLTGCASGTTGTTALHELSTPTNTFTYVTPSPTPPPSTAPAALDILQQLAVKAQYASGPFTASAFGRAGHPPEDASACDAVDYVYLRDLTQIQTSATSKCSVLAGALFDPYSGTWAWYVRRQATLNDVAVDHVVSLSDAWSTGASAWSHSELNGFYNDPLDLMATSTASIAAKADRDAAGWLPANPMGRCLYAIAAVAAKFKYRLWVTPTEKAALQQVLASCPATVTRPRPTSSPPPNPSLAKPVPKHKPASKP